MEETSSFTLATVYGLHLRIRVQRSIDNHLSNTCHSVIIRWKSLTTSGLHHSSQFAYKLRVNRSQPNRIGSLLHHACLVTFKRTTYCWSDRKIVKNVLVAPSTILLVSDATGEGVWLWDYWHERYFYKKTEDFGLGRLSCWWQNKWHFGVAQRCKEVRNRTWFYVLASSLTIDFCTFSWERNNKIWDFTAQSYQAKP